MVVLEQDHSPARLEAEEQQLELQQEVERLRSAQVQTERTLEARERAHQQRVRGLEEQVLGPDGLRPLPRGCRASRPPLLGRWTSMEGRSWRRKGRGRAGCDPLGLSSLWHQKLQWSGGAYHG